MVTLPHCQHLSANNEGSVPEDDRPPGNPCGWLSGFFLEDGRFLPCFSLLFPFALSVPIFLSRFFLSLFLFLFVFLFFLFCFPFLFSFPVFLSCFRSFGAGVFKFQSFFGFLFFFFFFFGISRCRDSTRKRRSFPEMGYNLTSKASGASRIVGAPCWTELQD